MVYLFRSNTYLEVNIFAFYLNIALILRVRNHIPVGNIPMNGVNVYLALNPYIF